MRTTPENFDLLFQTKEFALPSDPKKGAFNEPSILSSDIISELRYQLFKISPNALDQVTNCPAYIALSESLIEFLYNSSDAGATKVSIIFYSEKSKEKIQIAFCDDGAGISAPVERYDWMTAVQTGSAKANCDEMLGGQNLALATTAFFMEQHGGSLGLECNAPKGANVILSSNLKSNEALHSSGIRRDFITGDFTAINTDYRIGELLVNSNVIEAMLIALLMKNGIKTIFSTDAAKNKEQVVLDKKNALEILSKNTNPPPLVIRSVSSVKNTIEHLYLNSGILISAITGGVIELKEIKLRKMKLRLSEIRKSAERAMIEREKQVVATGNENNSAASPVSATEPTPGPENSPIVMRATLFAQQSSTPGTTERRTRVVNSPAGKTPESDSSSDGNAGSFTFLSPSFPNLRLGK